MSLKTFVKIGSISNLSDARYCAGMGADLLGFSLNPNDPDSISTKLFMDIKSWVAGIEFVGEFGNLSANKISQIQQQLPLNYLQVSDLQQVERVLGFGKPVIYQMEITTDEDLRKMTSNFSYLDELVEYLVLSTKNPDLYESINSAVSFYNGRIKLLRDFDIRPEIVGSIKGYYGIHLVGTEETEPGLKDYGEVMDVLEALELD